MRRPCARTSRSSTARIALLCESRIVEPGRCVVAHFDHRLRGEAAADADRCPVEAVCVRYGLRLVTGTWAAPRPGEAAAREARYAFLLETCRSSGLRVVVTGHTGDDQVETVLMNMHRGAGMYGLAGMSAEGIIPIGARWTGEGHLTLARPLVCVRREETRAYCLQRRLAFSDDESNEDERLLRNRVRRQLLPAIERGSPRARETLLEASEHARAVVRLLDESTARAVVERRQDRVVLSRSVLRELRPSGSAHALRFAVTQLLGDVREFAREHYAMMQGAIDARTGSTLQLPRSIELVVDAEALV